MTTRVLITGGAGFIGSNLSRRLLEADSAAELHVLDNLHPQVHRAPGRPSDLPEAVTLHAGDVTVPSNWDAVLKLVRPDVVVHLAAETGTGQSLTEASRHGRVNVVGTTELLDALHRNEVLPRHLILTSSRAVYGDGAWQAADGTVFAPSGRSNQDLQAGLWDYIGPDGAKAKPLASRADHTHPLPTNVYAATKLAQEHIFEAWGRAFSVPVTVLRLQNVYGPGQSLENSYTGIVALFSRLAVSGARAAVFEDGAMVRDFVYVDDVTQAIERAMLSPGAPGEPRTYDVGSGDPCTVFDVARILAQLADAPIPAISGQFRDGDVRAASCDITLTREDLGYLPEWPLERGLRSLLAWVRTQ